MTTKNLKINQLVLDLQNPRIGKVGDQRQAMQAIIYDQDIKLVNLAEHIVENGLNPLDRLLVLKNERGKYISLEGNRRTVALKLLANPAVLTGLDVRPAMKRRLEALARRFDKSKIEPIASFEVLSRAEANQWIGQRHKGEDEGRGIVGWSAEATKRFVGQDPALQALDFVRQRAQLTPSQREAISDKFPLTTLDRLLSSPAIRNKIGLDIKENTIVTDLPLEEVIKPLQRIILDLALKKINVTALKLVKQQLDYISKFDLENLPDFSRRTGESLPLDMLDEEILPPAAPIVRQKPPKTPRTPSRTALIPKSCHLNVTNNNTLEIYEELKKLSLNKFPNAIAVLLRVFMENSTDHYLDKHRIPLKYRPSSSSRDRHKPLEMKVNEAIEHMIVSGEERKTFSGVTRALSDQNHPLSIDVQHAYVHNRYVTPGERDLVLAWDNAQIFFEKIWI
jgi:hypothetical protein